MKKLAAILAVLVAMPIWFYLLHWLLKNAGAGELQMFLFWVYVPVTLLVRILAKLTEE